MKNGPVRERTVYETSEHISGREDFVRSKALAAVDENGTLSFSVDCQVWLDKPPKILATKRALSAKMVQLYNTDKEFNITFVLNSDLVRVYRFVLAVQCRTLYDFASEAGDGVNTEIDGADPDLFATIIRCMYF